MQFPPHIARRALLVGGLLLPTGSCTNDIPGTTPALREGPFYPRSIPGDADADLLHVAGADRPAQGEPLLLTGLVRRQDGTPLPGVALEIWQADANGINMHPHDPNLGRRDLGFQGYGRATTDGAGRYAFRTLRPGPYPGRTRHIHLRAYPLGRGRPLTTEIFFPDEAANEEDRLWLALSPAERAMLTVRLGTDAQGQRAEFDIVLG